MLADINLAAALLISLGALFVTSFMGALILRERAKGKAIEIPGAMKPGPSDAALETPLLHKLQGWGVVLVAFFVVWFPVTWLFEPSINKAQEEDLKTRAIERGAAAVQLFSEQNQLGVGCVRCHGPELRGGVIASGAGYAYPKNLTDLCGGILVSDEHREIVSTDDIYQVIQQGRGAMPSWSIRYQGALDDQQINDIVNYLVSMSSKNVPYKDNVCLNKNAQERALTKAQAEGVVLERP